MSLPTRYNLLKEFPNEYYVETGIWRGDSLAQAKDAGFKTIIGVELFDEWIAFCKNRFDLFRDPGSQIHLYKGDSAKDLFSVIEHIREPITFFLDSHSQMLEDEPEIENPFPLLQELEQIKRWYGMHTSLVKPPTIIIDDMLIMQLEIVGYDKRDVVFALDQINFDYNIEFRANPVKNNILIAWPEK